MSETTFASELEATFGESFTGVGVSETGALEAKFSEPTEMVLVDDSGEPVAQPEAKAAEPAPEPKAAEPAPVPAPSHDWEKRYNSLQPEFTRRSQENKQLRERLAFLEGKLSAAPKPEAEPETDLLDVMNDPVKYREHLDREVSRRVEEKMRPLKAQLEPLSDYMLDAEVTRELRDCITEFPDFAEWQPHVNRFITATKGQLPFKESYLRTKEFYGGKLPTAGPASAPNGTPTPAADASAKGSLADLQSRAAQLATETGVGGKLSDPVVAVRPAESMKEALEQTLTQLGITLD